MFRARRLLAPLTTLSLLAAVFTALPAAAAGATPVNTLPSFGADVNVAFDCAAPSDTASTLNPGQKMIVTIDPANAGDCTSVHGSATLDGRLLDTTGSPVVPNASSPIAGAGTLQFWAANKTLAGVEEFTIVTATGTAHFTVTSTESGSFSQLASLAYSDSAVHEGDAFTFTATATDASSASTSGEQVVIGYPNCYQTSIDGFVQTADTVEGIAGLTGNAGPAAAKTTYKVEVWEGRACWDTLGVTPVSATMKVYPAGAVIDTTPPVITGSAAPSITAPATSVLTYTADETVTWSISGGADQAKFDISAGGALAFKAASTASVYTVKIRATDAEGNYTDLTVVVTVNPADVTAPTITGSTTPSINAPATAVLTYTADEAVTWSITGGTDQALFQISAGGALSFKAASTAGSYLVKITATDGSSNATEKTITVTVNDVTAPTVTGSTTPSINAPATAVLTYTANETVTWSITGGADQALFQISAGGALSFKAASTAGSYVVKITATDGASNATEKTITVTVNDVTAPTVTGSTTPSINAPATAVLTYTANETVTWSITGGADQALFQISAAGALSFKAASAVGTYVVKITATDGSSNATEKTITVTVNDGTAPTITGSRTPTVSAPATVVLTYTASEAVTWSITGGANQALFQISAAGVLSFKAASAVGTYVVKVTATDAASNATEITVTVTVVDLTPPTVTGPTTAVTVSTGATAVTTLTANETVTWSISPTANGSLFQISAAGAVSFKAASTAGTYTVFAVATDAGSNTTMKMITVVVGGTAAGTGGTGGTTTPPVTNNNPVVTASSSADGSATLTITDPDNDATTVTIAKTSKTVTVDYTAGKLTVTDAKFTGKVTVDVKVTDARGGSVTVPVELTVSPKPAAKATATMTSTAAAKTNAVHPVSTKIAWTASPNATGYRIVINGATVGEVSTTSYTTSTRIGPKTTVMVIAVGNDATVAAPVTATVTAGKFALGTVSFAAKTAALTTAGKAQLNSLAAIIASYGYTQVSLTGAVDGKETTNKISLSVARATAVKAYLASKLAGARVTITAVPATGSTVGSNATAAGRALNRRVDVTITG